MTSIGPVLWAASQEGCGDDLINILSNDGVDLEVTSGIMRCTPLHISCREGHFMNTMYLLDHGAVVSARDRDGWTPLHYACFKNHKIVVFLLLQNGADPSAQDESGLSPLMLSAHMGTYHIVDLLLYKGADVEASDKKGLTPLHWAVKLGSEKIVSLLLRYGANVNAVTLSGDTCETLASSQGNVVLALVFKRSVQKIRKPVQAKLLAHQGIAGFGLTVVATDRFAGAVQSIRKGFSGKKKSVIQP
jgi:ankyrin repeat protein